MSSDTDSHITTTTRENEEIWRLLEEIAQKLEWIVSQMLREAKSKL